MRISDWSSDVCSSDLDVGVGHLDAMAVRGYRLPEQADARPAAPGMSRQHIEQLRPVDQLLATAPLDVPEEAAGPDEAGEVEQGAAGLCGGDAVDIDDLAAIQVRALVHDEARTTKSRTSRHGDLGRSVAIARDLQAPGGC